MVKQNDPKLGKFTNSKSFHVTILILLVLVELVVFTQIIQRTLGIIQIMVMATTGATTGYIIGFLIFVALQIIFLIWTIRQIIWFSKQQR